MSDKLATASDALALIEDGDTVCTSGFVGAGVPEELLIALERRFRDTGSPRDLTLVYAAGQGDGKERGLNRLAHPGLLKRAVGGHWGLAPRIGAMALNGDIEAWNLPQGVISQLFREIAGNRPGVFTKVGLDTFVDPLHGGGAINARSTEALVTRVEIDGEPWLRYRSFPIQAALIRATTADEAGNLSMEREALVLDALHMAMAARNSGGVVIAQVERMAARGSLPPKQVVVPAALVDAVVIAAPENHWQTFATPYSPRLSGELRAPASDGAHPPLDARKIIARRCAMELPVGGVVNLGIGMPEGVAGVAAEEHILETVTLTAEPGIMGGRPASGLDFGAAVNTDAIISQSATFDFYDGGGLDMACLGMAEADAAGDVNVSRFGDRLAGAGGFINISQNARKLVFAGTFTAGGLAVRTGDGSLSITAEGRSPKFVETVAQVTFSAARALQNGLEVLYVTERCVLRLSDDGLVLAEVAPGVVVARDILPLMAFRPLGAADAAPMDAAIFHDSRMGLRERLDDLKLPARVHFDPSSATLFLDFEGLRVKTEADVAAIRDAVEATLQGVEGRVDVVVTYARFEIERALEPAYRAMVRDLESRLYGRVTRHARNAFTRLLIARALTGD